MHVLIPVGVLVVFICSFFAIYSYDYLVSQNIQCLKTGVSQKLSCQLGQVGPSFLMGVLLIGFFATLGLVVLYVIVRFLLSPQTINAPIEAI